MDDPLADIIVISESDGVIEGFEGNLSSPYRMVWVVFDLLRKCVSDVPVDVADNEAVKRQAALAIILCVAAVETFLNSYFRILVGEEEF